ncbi:uncharacterized protein BT62DRAFT_1009618 [Guyanagaster necrorhizus]|uniref:Uncharacterized protein n=1 Tax=Guyanagaster necrorhizus TaxID=856835 RepID=A0A9P8APP8_9AGAR|nr:uncharacterized protein BT62DRAFT_1009618 [Guyanagaster necrorhizus MCA 3950]KAG7443016.1 hypothetical protein BT62DRAFT_1009618 [Guyanagaster necrorhizus MCA 3950]
MTSPHEAEYCHPLDQDANRISVRSIFQRTVGPVTQLGLSGWNLRDHVISACLQLENYPPPWSAESRLHLIESIRKSTVRLCRPRSSPASESMSFSGIDQCISPYLRILNVMQVGTIPGVKNKLCRSQRLALSPVFRGSVICNSTSRCDEVPPGT